MKKFIITVIFLTSNLFSYDQEHIILLYSKIKNLSNLDLSNSHLKGLHLKKKNLINCDFSGSIIEKVSFYDCNFNNSNFSINEESSENTQIDESSFENCKMVNTNFFKSNINNSEFKGVNANNSFFIGSSLEATKIEDSSFCGSLFNHTAKKKKKEIKLKNLNDPAILNNCQLTNVTFKNSKLNNVIINESELINIDFSFTQAIGLFMQNSVTFLTNFYNAILDNARFLYSELYDSSLDCAKSSYNIEINPNSIHENEILFLINNTEDINEVQTQIYEEYTKIYNLEEIQIKDFYNENLELPQKIHSSSYCQFCTNAFEINENIAVYCCCGNTSCVECANKILSTPSYYNPNEMKQICPFCTNRIEGYNKIFFYEKVD